MDERRSAEAATTAATATTNQGVNTHTLAKATDIPQPELAARLDTPGALTFADMVKVGGFLRIHPAALLGGLA